MKKEKGFTLIELTISIVAFILFASVVANLNYQIFSNSIESKRTALATEKAVENLNHEIAKRLLAAIERSNNLVSITDIKGEEFNSLLLIILIEKLDFSLNWKNNAAKLTFEKFFNS